MEMYRSTYSAIGMAKSAPFLGAVMPRFGRISRGLGCGECSRPLAIGTGVLSLPILSIETIVSAQIIGLRILSRQDAGGAIWTTKTAGFPLVTYSFATSRRTGRHLWQKNVRHP